MNYQKHYNLLMERSPKIRFKGVYLEKHRIIPGCMGGKYVKGNVVYLTPEEHYIAHQLLIKIYPNNGKLIYAANFMSKNTNQHQRNNNKSFGWIRRKLAQQVSKDKKGNKYCIGRKHSQETIEKNRIWHLGVQSHTTLTKDDVLKIREQYNRRIDVPGIEMLGKNARNGRAISYKSLFSKHISNVYNNIITPDNILRIVDNKTWKI